MTSYAPTRETTFTLGPYYQITHMQPVMTRERAEQIARLEMMAEREPIVAGEKRRKSDYDSLRV